MHCGHINGLKDENAAEEYGFTDGGEYVQQVVDAVAIVHNTPGVLVQKVRLREERSPHDAKGAMLMYGEALSVHSRSHDNKTSYFIAEMTRAQNFFETILPYTQDNLLGVDAKSVYEAYSNQAMVTLQRVSTIPGRMPVLKVYATNPLEKPLITLVKRV